MFTFSKSAAKKSSSTRSAFRVYLTRISVDVDMVSMRRSGVGVGETVSSASGSANSEQGNATRTATLASQYADFLHEQAPEAVLSRLHNTSIPILPNATLFRRLISMLLRASTPHVVQRVSSALECATSTAREENCDEYVVLGFTTSTLKENLPALYDVLTCLVNGDMLIVDGKALTLYSGAGSGATDQEEYMMPGSDGLRGSSSFGSMHPPLTDTRRTALVTFVKHIAKHNPLIFANDQRALAILTEKSVTRAVSLYSDALDALHALLDSLYNSSLKRTRDDISVRLVNAFVSVATDDALCPSLGVYLRAMPGPTLMLDCCHRFLVQRFSLKIGQNERLSFKVFYEFINRQFPSNHPFLKVLPAVCACIATALVSQGDLREFKSDLTAMQHEDDGILVATMISLGDQLRRTCKAPEADGDWLVNTFFALQACIDLRSK